MRLMDAHAKLLKLNAPSFRTTDAASQLKISNAHASKLLSRLAETGHIVRLYRSLWALPGKIEFWNFLDI